MAITNLTGTRAASKAANPRAIPGGSTGTDIEFLGAWDNGAVRAVSEQCTLTADAAGYEATDGLRAVLKIGTIPKNTKLLQFIVNIGAITSSAADKFIIAKDGDTAGTYTAISTVGSLTAAAGTVATIYPLNFDTLTEDTPIYLLPYENGDTDDVATLKDEQVIGAVAFYQTVENPL